MTDAAANPAPANSLGQPKPAGQRIVASLGVIIATVGRKEIAEQTIGSLALRKTVPSIVIIVGANEKDLPALTKDLPFEVQLLIAPMKGLPIQRNFGIQHLPASVEFVSFLDDDMEVHDNYCSEVENVFRTAPEVAGFSGCILANGGIDRPGARQLLDDHQTPPDMPAFGFYPKRWPGFYGCAMNIRKRWLSVEQFDERLPLYAIGEDCEMGFRLSRHGSVGGSARCPVVHLATRSGRISEVGLGYAQIINYLYYANKGIGFPKVSTWFESLIRLPLVNLFFSLFPSRDKKNSIDRKGRFRGNILAVCDVLRFKIDPMNLVRRSAQIEKKSIQNVKKN
jgi:GT2 family glycosyltransferase